MPALGRHVRRWTEQRDWAEWDAEHGEGGKWTGAATGTITSHMEGQDTPGKITAPWTDVSQSVKPVLDAIENGKPPVGFWIHPDGRVIGPVSYHGAYGDPNKVLEQGFVRMSAVGKSPGAGQGTLAFETYTKPSAAQKEAMATITHNGKFGGLYTSSGNWGKEGQTEASATSPNEQYNLAKTFGDDNEHAEGVKRFMDPGRLSTRDWATWDLEHPYVPKGDSEAPKAEAASEKAAPLDFTGNKSGAAEWGVANFKDWNLSLPQEQQDAMSNYTQGGYSDMNHLLREDGAWIADPEAAQKNVDNLTAALATAPAVPETIVSRGTTLTGEAFDKMSQLKEGDTYTDKGFGSTSLSNGFGGNVRMSITLPEGLKGAGYPLKANDEREMILQRGMQYKVESTSQDEDGTLHLQMTALGSDVAQKPVELKSVEMKSMGRFTVRDWAQWDAEHPYIPHPKDPTGATPNNEGGPKEEKWGNWTKADPDEVRQSKIDDLTARAYRDNPRIAQSNPAALDKFIADRVAEIKPTTDWKLPNGTVVSITNGVRSTPEQQKELMDVAEKLTNKYPPDQYPPPRTFNILDSKSATKIMSRALGATVQGGGQIWIAPKVFAKDAQEKHDADTAAGWHSPAAAGHTRTEYVMTHEFGHTLDTPGHTDEVKAAIYPKTRDDYKPATSRYGQTDSAERYAEAFAEHELSNGQTEMALPKALAPAAGWK